MNEDLDDDYDLVDLTDFNDDVPEQSILEEITATAALVPAKLTREQEITAILDAVARAKQEAIACPDVIVSPMLVELQVDPTEEERREKKDDVNVEDSQEIIEPEPVGDPTPTPTKKSIMAHFTMTNLWGVTSEFLVSFSIFSFVSYITLRLSESA